jgi:CheY-like chemotaxis protein
VLIVDDEASQRKAMSALLARVVAELAVANDGQQAVAMVANSMAEGRAFDVVLMDVQMPKLDGCEAASEMRSWGFGGGIVALSGRPSKELEERCLRSGFDRFLEKPYVASELIEVVQGYCCWPLLQAKRKDVDTDAYQIVDCVRYAIVRLRQPALWSDHASSPESPHAKLRRDLLRLSDENAYRAIFFDLTDMALLCSQLIALFIMCHHHSMRVQLCNPSQQAREALEATKLDGFFVVSDTQ